MEHIVFGTEGELRKALADLNQNMMQKTLAHKGIRWSFNPPMVSHDGGTWERIIKMVRQVLSSVLCQQTLDDEGLHTFLCEIEAILND